MRIGNGLARHSVLGGQQTRPTWKWECCGAEQPCGGKLGVRSAGYTCHMIFYLENLPFLWKLIKASCVCSRFIEGGKRAERLLISKHTAVADSFPWHVHECLVHQDE
jgi:hypothetical protein